MKTILVQLAEPEWTQEALHLACAMSQHTGAGVTLLHLIPVQHVSWLGTSLANQELSPEASARVWEYRAIAQGYGVDLELMPMQYVSCDGALLEAAEMTNSEAVFARIPGSPLTLWQRFQSWNLRRKFQALGCALYTLDHPAQSIMLEMQLGKLAPAQRTA
jgi:hypothetical protein